MERTSVNKRPPDAMPRPDDMGMRAMILKAAALSKLELSGAEWEQAKRDLQNMLECSDKLQELDTEGIEPAYHAVPMGNVLREDKVANGDGREQLLRNAPQSRDNLFVVPETF